MMKRNYFSWVLCALTMLLLTGAPATELSPPAPEEGTILRPNGLPDVSNPEIPATPGQGASVHSHTGGGRTTAATHAVRSTIGRALTTAAPDYLFGDVIAPPLTDHSGTQQFTPTEAAAYWRKEPIHPGESVKTLDPDDGDVPVPADFQPSYHYSRHAERVYASHNGKVTITWRSRLPIDADNHFATRSIDYKVASITRLAVRRIYWTEGRSTGPTVSIPLGHIQDVSIIYNNRMPSSVPDGEVLVAPPAQGGDLENRTFWFDSAQGVLRAANREGRVLIEYLGGARGDAGSGLRQSLGVEVVQVSQETIPIEVETMLGERLLPKADGVTTDARVDVLAPFRVTQSTLGFEQFVEQHAESGVEAYYAVGENLEPLRVQFYWLERGLRDVLWPTYLNSYRLVWPEALADYDARFVRPADAERSDETFVALPPENTPELVYQDDHSNLQAQLDFQQHLSVDLGSGDSNRSLLRFSAGNDFWYVRVYTAPENQLDDLDGEAGIDIQESVSVGQRIDPPAVADSLAGYIDSSYGTAYDPVAYQSPFGAAGLVAAEQGSIIAVNALPGNDRLRVWWFEKLMPPPGLQEAFQPIYFPAYVGEYSISYPADADTIVLASNRGSGDLVSQVSTGEIYVQNDPNHPGYNPNEEHAIMLAGRAYALRDDLNVKDVSSDPFVLIRYQETDQRPSMKVFEVLRESEDYQFTYPATAGTLIQAPSPLPFIPQPLLSHGQSRNVEILTDANDLPPHQEILEEHNHYDRFTYEDRKGSRWVYRGPHASDGAQPAIGMQFYYKTQDGFAFPNDSDGRDNSPAVGTIVPYLRPLDATGNPVGDPITGTPLTVRYEPRWPDQVPELRYGETLTLSKFGLPQVRGQRSVQVIYEGALANAGNRSVQLYDPTRRKILALSMETGALDRLPVSIATSEARGKTYFQNLASHLQDRFYFDPLLETSGALVLSGAFIDEVAGEDYLLLNVLSDEDLQSVRDLCDAQDARKSAWDEAVANLSTQVDRFIENPDLRGTYIVDPDGAHANFNTQAPSILTSPPAKPTVPIDGPDGFYDEAVDSYALSAVGGDSGYVTLLAGNGRAFTPEEEPVAIHILRVGGGLYRGELKPVVASNPLSENVTVQHTADFAGEPSAYEFEWRKAPPVDGLSPMVTALDYQALPLDSAPFTVRRDAISQSDGSYTWTDNGTTTMPAALEINEALAGDGDPGLSLLGQVPIGASVSDKQQLSQVYLGLAANSGDGILVRVNGVEVVRHQLSGKQTLPQDANTLTEDISLLMDGVDWIFAIEPSVFSNDGSADTVEAVYWSGTAPGDTTLLDLRIALTVETDVTSTTYAPVTSAPEIGKNRHLVSGAGIDVLGDNYFIMRYRPRDGHALYPEDGYSEDEGWSRWTRPALVEGWIKRVLAGINPFNQRLEDFFENAIDTDISLLSQAGTRWEGDIALTLDNVQDVGLIEIYETVLKRGVKLSIEGTPPTDYAPANDALLLAAGYLADLYTALGDEAYVDASNPTILVDAGAAHRLSNAAGIHDFDSLFQSTATSRFAFQGQVASLLEEELALLRGRNDLLAPGVQISPGYNRLYWNYTRGIDAGEVIYALNYNITEKDGEDSADGKVDAEDAQRLFPQGHGDAYGHYLTALTNYYRLLTNSEFTWGTRSETVNVLGQPLSIDYLDERKFAKAASSLARTAEQIQGLEQRKAHESRPSAGWAHFRPSGDTDSMGRLMTWSLDDWSSRGGQGAFYHWAVANAILPHEDTEHQGIQKIDRSTVPELNEIASRARMIQENMSSAENGLNPLELSADSVVFDISPAELSSGKTHFEQIYERSVRSLQNAFKVFDRATESSRLLRAIENQDSLLNEAVVDEERAFVGQLNAIFGKPYAGDLGPGKTYPQDYDGPDLYRYMYIDRPFEIFSKEELFATDNGTRDVKLPLRDNGYIESFKHSFEGSSILGGTVPSPNPLTYVRYTLRDSDGPYQIATESSGKRPQVGSIQEALAAVILTEEQRFAALAAMDKAGTRFLRQLDDIENDLRDKRVLAEQRRRLFITEASFQAIFGALSAVQSFFERTNRIIGYNTDAVVGSMPTVVGLASDPSAALRGLVLNSSAVLRTSNEGVQKVALRAKKTAEVALKAVESTFAILESRKEEEAFFRSKFAQVEALYEESIAEYRRVDAAHVAYVRALERYQTELHRGEAILAERENFRKRAAAIVQGYRTRDVAFRTFRTEALEQYEQLFDQAARYAYLAAQAYDYETGLLGNEDGRRFLGKFVSARALGLLDDEGEPAIAGSSTGDTGLSGLLAQLASEWDVAKGRLGFNNPEQFGTLFSMRQEAYRVPDTPNADRQWKEKLASLLVDNLLADADVAAHALQLDQDGTPVPGFVLPFQSRIAKGENFFGLPLSVGDHRFSESNFATKIHSVGVVFKGYKGMDPCFVCTPEGIDGPDTSDHPDALSATPNVYLLPTGADIIRTPQSVGGFPTREWQVLDHALPYPADIGVFTQLDDLTWDRLSKIDHGFLDARRHQAFRAVGTGNYFYHSHESDFTSSRLVGRSVENTRWKLVIPASELLVDESDGIRRFINAVTDIQLYFRTYSHAGN